jgi:hypothetical protein
VLRVEPGVADASPGVLVTQLPDQAVDPNPQVWRGVGGAAAGDPLGGDLDGRGEPQRDAEGVGARGGGQPGLGHVLGEPGRGEVLRGVPLLADAPGYRGVGEVDHRVADVGGDLLFGVPEGVGVHVGGHGAGDAHDQLSTVEASTGAGCGSMLVGGCGSGVMAVVILDAPGEVTGWR